MGAPFTPPPVAGVQLSRGYRPLYHGGARCPGCNSSNWHIGRSSAECARCGTALPLAPAPLKTSLAQEEGA